MYVILFSASKKFAWNSGRSGDFLSWKWSIHSTFPSVKFSDMLPCAGQCFQWRLIDGIGYIYQDVSMASRQQNTIDIQKQSTYFENKK